MAIAREQHGIVTLAQLRALGLADSSVRDRVHSGRLRRVHRGVYAVGPLPLDSAGLDIAAVLACGRDVMLFRRSAAALWGARPSSRRTVEVITPARSGRRHAGVEVHARTTLTSADRTRVDGIPITSLARTLLDLAAVVDVRQIERAIQRADELQIFDLAAVEELLARSAGQRGAGYLRQAIGRPIAPTRNELERAMLAICRNARLPEPRVNEWLALPDGSGFRPDFWWPERGLVVETDGYEEHSKRRAFGHDRARDRRLKLAADIETYRCTWEEVMRTPAAVASELAGLLAAAQADAPAA